MSLRLRLALGSAAAMAVVVLIVSALVYVTVRDQLRGQVDDQLRARAAALVPAIAFARERADVLTGGVTLPAPPPGRAQGVVQVITRGGAVQGPFTSAVRLPVDGPSREVASGERVRVLSTSDVQGRSVRILTAALPDAGAVQVALPLDDVDDVLGRLRWAMGLIGGAGVVVAGLLAAVVARTGLAPVRRLDRTAEEVAHTGDLGRRIDVDRQDEVGRLAGTFNEMLAALERSRDAQRNLVLDASHELRTPLTALRTNIEVLAEPDGLDDASRERVLADVRSQVEDLSALIADVVSLAEGAEPPREPEEVRLDLLVAAAVERARRDAPALRFTLDAEPVVVRGAPGRLARAIANLLDNAAKFSPAGGAVEVRVAAGGEVSVRDHGPGIAPGDLPHVFDRFYRAAGARRLPGSGLGLAIVRQAAEVHGGTAVAEAAPGGGAVLRLRIPPIGD
jgi:two-component system sensor histidine kinase MprB